MSTPDDVPARGTAPRRIALALGSVFAAWHALAMLLGTAPPSYLHGELMPLYRGYIEALHLDGRWGFFAPNPSAGRLLRYRVERANGASDEHPFTEALRRADPAYLRFTTLSSAADPEHAQVQRSVAQALCRRHAALAPRRIHFVGLQQLRITPEQVEAGGHALDAAQLERVELGSMPCQG